MDIHQTRTKAMQEKTDPNLKETKAGREHTWKKTLRSTDKKWWHNAALSRELQIKTQTAKVLNEATWREFQKQLKEVDAWPSAEEEQEPATGVVKPPKFEETTPWALFRRQFETVAEQNCWMHKEKSTCFITTMQERSHSVIHESPKRRGLWRNPWDPKVSLWGPAPARRISQSAKIEDTGFQRTLVRICHSCQTAGPRPRLLHTREPNKGGGCQGIRRRGRTPQHKSPAAARRENCEWGSQASQAVGCAPSSQA
jgi:hypothetical protein